MLLRMGAFQALHEGCQPVSTCEEAANGVEANPCVEDSHGNHDDVNPNHNERDGLPLRGSEILTGTHAEIVVMGRWPRKFPL